MIPTVYLRLTPSLIYLLYVSASELLCEPYTVDPLAAINVIPTVTLAHPIRLHAAVDEL